MIFLQTDLKPEFVREKQESNIFLLNGMNNVSEGCFMELKFYTNSTYCKAYCSHNHSWNKKKYVKKTCNPIFWQTKNSWALTIVLYALNGSIFFQQHKMIIG